MEPEKPDESAESNRSGFGIEDIHETNRREPQNSENTIWILKYWVKRAKLVRLIRSQIAGLLEKMTNSYCNFCGINWGLRGETIENIEEIFMDFWRELMENEKKLVLKENESKYKRKKQESQSSFDKQKRIYEIRDIIKWQQYFQKHATVRTICFECMGEVHEKKKGISSLNEQNKLSQEPNFSINKEESNLIEKKNTNISVKVESTNLKAILLNWLYLIRNKKE